MLPADLAYPDALSLRELHRRDCNAGAFIRLSTEAVSDQGVTHARIVLTGRRCAQ
jgi:hypothetical protein